MSKQSDCKKIQGYIPRAIPSLCSNCNHFRFDMELPAWMVESNKRTAGIGIPAFGDECKRQKNMRCGIGEFAVKKTGVCAIWIKKE